MRHHAFLTRITRPGRLARLLCFGALLLPRTIGSTGETRGPGAKDPLDSQDTIPCPICAGRDTRLAYPLIECDLYECGECFHLFSKLKPGIEAESYGDDYYLDRHREYFENPDLALFERTLVRLEHHWKPQGNVVDVGCGNGNWLAVLRERGYHAYGVETSPAAAAAAKERGLQVACTTIDAYQPPVPMDGLISWYVVEHIEEIDAFIADSAKILPEGGVAAFATVDSGSTVYQLGKLLHRISMGHFRGPLQRICEIHHLQHFSRRSLDWTLRKNGFEVLERFSAPFPVSSVKASSVQRLLLRIAYGIAALYDSHFIQVVIARRTGS